MHLKKGMNMEKLNSMNFSEKLKVFKKTLKNSDVAEHMRSINQNDKRVVYILIFSIILPEIFIYFGKIGEALYLYAGILAALSLMSLFTKDQEIRNICQIFLLIPIFRLVNFSMPYFPQSPLISFIFIYTPMIIPVAFVIINQQFTHKELGITSKNLLYYFPLSIFIGLILGRGEYFNLQTVPLIPEFSLTNILLLTSIMIFLVGAIEEIIFRSILQTKLEGTVGMKNGIILSSITFGIMSSGYGNFYAIVYAIFVGLLIGFIFQKTRSLPLAIMIHGFINVFSFGIIPYLGSEFSLF